MTRHKVLATTLKHWLNPRSEAPAVRGTWRDTGVETTPCAQPANTETRRPGFYRSEAFAEDLYESAATPN